MTSLTTLAQSAPGRSPDRLDSIQMLRGVAAMLVVYNHAALFLAREPDLGLGVSVLAPSDVLASLGAIGVDLFFIISGFLMAYTARDRTGLRDSLRFMTRRWIRIAPLFYLMSAIVAIALWYHHVPISEESVLNSLTFVPLLDNEDYSWPVHYLGWTLAFEFTFYVIVAIAVASGLGARPGLLIAVTFALPVIGWWTTPDHAAAKILLSPMMWEFTMGVAAYAIWRAGWLRLVAPYTAILAIPLAAMALLLLASPVNGTPTSIAQADHALEGSRIALVRALNWGLPMLLLFLWFVCSPLVDSRRWDGRLLLVLGDASYSIYLTHLAVVRVAQEVVERHPLNADLVVTGVVIGSAILGIVCYRWVERPLLVGLTGPRLSPAGTRRPSS